MASNHFDKWIIKSILGLLLIIAAVFITFYAIAYRQDYSRWVLYAVCVSVTMAAGIFLVGSAFIHKMKFDIKHRQKVHQQAESLG